jgi:hypothetical protein
MHSCGTPDFRELLAKPPGEVGQRYDKLLKQLQK